MRSLILTSLLLVSALAVLGAPVTSAAEDIPALSADMLEQEVYLSDRPHLIGIYDPSQEQHSELFFKVWGAVAKKIKSVVPVWSMNATNPVNHQLFATLKIERVPTVLLFPAKTEWETKSGTPYKNPSVIQTFETKTIVSQALKFLPNDVQLLTKANHDKFLASKPELKALLFSNKKKTSSLAKGLACEYARRIGFGEVRDSEEDLVAKYGIDSYPSLLVIGADGSPVTYKGEMKHDPIVEFLDTHAPARTNPSPPKPPSVTVTLTDDTYNTRLLQSIKTWLVFFYRGDCESDKKCSAALAQYETAANDFDGGIARLGVVNLDENPEMAEKYVAKSKKLPAIRYFNPDPKTKQKRKPVEYKGKITARKLWAFVTDKITNYAEPVFDNKGIDDFIRLREDVGKVILFTNKRETSPLWKAVSYHYKNRISCVEVHSESTEVIERFGVRPEAFPVIVAFLPELQKDPETGKQKKGLKPVPYQGKLRFQGIVQWLSPLAREWDEDELEVQEAEEARDVDESKLVPHIRSAENFKEHCEDKAQLCLIAIVADSDVKSGRPHIMSTLVASAIKLKKERSVAFMWANGDKQTAVTTALAPNGLPTLVMINPRKKAYSTLIGSVSDVGSVTSFVRGLLSGRGAIRRLTSDLPDWVDEEDSSNKDEL